MHSRGGAVASSDRIPENLQVSYLLATRLATRRRPARPRPQPVKPALHSTPSATIALPRAESLNHPTPYTITIPRRERGEVEEADFCFLFDTLRTYLVTLPSRITPPRRLASTTTSRHRQNVDDHADDDHRCLAPPDSALIAPPPCLRKI